MDGDATEWVGGYHCEGTCNLVCLCKHHHRARHRGEFTLTSNADIPNGLVFVNKFGRPIPNGPKPAPPATPPAAGSWIHPTGEAIHEPWIWLPHSA